MTRRSPGSAVTALLMLGVLTLSGCATTGLNGTAETPSSSPTPSTPEPPSTPVAETELRDEVDGTTVTPLAIVTELPGAEPPSDGLHAVLVKVRLQASDEFSSQVFPSVVSITRRDADFDLVTLGLSNPETLTPAMSAAGYSPLTAVGPGETVTAWIGAWMNGDVTEFDLVYDRGESTVVGGDRDGETLPAVRHVAPLVLD